jgi:hypothetical protein
MNQFSPFTSARVNGPHVHECRAIRRRRGFGNTVRVRRPYAWGARGIGTARGACPEVRSSLPCIDIPTSPCSASCHCGKASTRTCLWSLQLAAVAAGPRLGLLSVVYLQLRRRRDAHASGVGLSMVAYYLSPRFLSLSNRSLLSPSANAVADGALDLTKKNCAMTNGTSPSNSCRERARA